MGQRVVRGPVWGACCDDHCRPKASKPQAPGLNPHCPILNPLQQQSPGASLGLTPRFREGQGLCIWPFPGPTPVPLGLQSAVSPGLWPRLHSSFLPSYLHPSPPGAPHSLPHSSGMKTSCQTNPTQSPSKPPLSLHRCPFHPALPLLGLTCGSVPDTLNDPPGPSCSPWLLQGPLPALPFPPEEDLRPQGAAPSSLQSSHPLGRRGPPLHPCANGQPEWETDPLGAGALLLLVPRARPRLSAV